MSLRIPSVAAAGLLALISIAGCRTYGRFGSERANYEQLKRSVSVFDEELGRAQSDLESARAAVEGDSAGEEFVSELAEVVDEHASTLEEQERLLEGLSEDTGYLELSRALGAVDAQHLTIHGKYQRLLQARYNEARYNQARYTGAADSTGRAAPARPYHLIPPYYNRITERTPTVKEVVTEILAGRGQTEEATPMTMMEQDTTAVGQ